MSRRAASALIAACLLAAAAPAGAATAPFFGAPLFGARQEPALDFAYRGWTVHARAAARLHRAEKVVSGIKAQIDIVEQAGLKPGALKALRALPIEADLSTGREVGHYTADRRVMLRVRALDAKRPSLLHAVLLAYDDRLLPGGFGNPEIARFRQAIVARHVWPKTAAMLQNDGEFFAVTASAYLYGEITREPYTRADLKKTQPDYYQWLANLFDDGRPRDTAAPPRS